MAGHTEGRAIHWARLYDLGTTLFSFGRLSALHRSIVDLARVVPGERLLDVGCGPGRLAILAATVTGPGGESRGIDPAPEMVELARRKAARAGVPARFDVGAIETLPYPDDHFHVVLSSLMLHHLPDELKDRGLREVRRVLRPAGRLGCLEITQPTGLLRPFFDLWFDRLVPLAGRLLPGGSAYEYLPASVRRFPGPRDLATVCAGAGFAQIRWRMLGGGIVALHTAAKALPDGQRDL